MGGARDSLDHGRNRRDHRWGEGLHSSLLRSEFSHPCLWSLISLDRESGRQRETERERETETKGDRETESETERDRDRGEGERQREGVQERNRDKGVRETFFLIIRIDNDNIA
jgi:hypothetical protein